MSARGCFRHDVLVYESDEEYVDRAAAFLREGLEAGEWGIVGNTRAGLARMREAMGPDVERLTFVDVSATYDRPARAVAAYHGLLVEHLERSPSLRVVSDLQIGPAPEEWNEWVRYEAITNVAYSNLPAWIVCSYDANAVPDPVLEAASKTHRQTLGDGWHPSEGFEDPAVLVRKLTPEPEPIEGLSSSFPGDDLELFREQLARGLAAAKVPEAPALNMLVAGTEVARNAIRHGGGIKQVRMGRPDGCFVCEVVDHGSGFDDPVAGYLAPRPGTGTGLWVARQLSRRVECFRAPRGFTVRIWL
jgi:anti-sigma regulatory factor (Ser/Thr protein kinase)